MTTKTSVAVSVALPAQARSKEGYEFNPSEEHWRIVDNAVVANFKFDELRRCCDSALVDSYKQALLHYVENYALSSACGMHTLFLRLCRSLQNNGDGWLSRISSTVIINYKAYIGSNEWYLGSLRTFFKKWYELGYQGVDNDAIRLLDEMRLKGAPKGYAVLTMDPQKGPLTENELLALHEELCNRYRSGAISNREFALVWLFMAIGQRSVQYAMLKVMDFEAVPANDGSVRYFLNMPRAKQQGTYARELFKRRALCDEAGTALSVWIEQLKAYYREHFTDGIEPKELPIFPKWGYETNLGLHHMVSTMLRRELVETIGKLRVISERTGDIIKFQSKRFRYTIGTRAAEEGHGELVIAELLDHTDTQNVQVYTKSTSRVARIIDKAMAPYLAPLAQAFKGMIISSNSDCPDGARIRSGNPDARDVGKCGQHGFCGAAVPHVCYTCIDFYPWLDGPHEEILQELLDERDRVLANTGDERIAGAKDRLILAVTQVVEMCAAMKAGEAANG